jgi:hypothetical protein
MRATTLWLAALAVGLLVMGACGGSSKKDASGYASTREQTAASPPVDAPAAAGQAGPMADYGGDYDYDGVEDEDDSEAKGAEEPAPAPAMPRVRTRAEPTASPPVNSAPPAGGQQAQGQPPGQGGQPAQVAADGPAQPMLIYTANLHLAVFEAGEALEAIEQLARQKGGYLVRRTDNNIVVRVPAPIFHEALAEVAKLGDVLHRDVSAQDVTAEFRDLEVRLKNLQAVRGRLQQLLAQAKNVQDALQVERELERVTTQIEQIKGRLKLFRELVAFSTIQVTFQPRPVEKVTSIVKLPFGWLDDLGLNRLLDLSY